MIKSLNKTRFILEKDLEFSPVIPKEMSFSHDIHYFSNQKEWIQNHRRTRSSYVSIYSLARV